MEQLIIGYSGKKQSGKGTCAKQLQLWRPETQEFNFADPLKRMCIDILGLEEWQAYGTDEQKNTLVPHLLWENFPVPVWCYPNQQPCISTCSFVSIYKYEFDDATEDKYNFVFPERKTGPMTAREVLQFWGTEIFRKQYHDVWADACIRAIRKSQCKVAVITDCRFPNEVSAVQAAGGKVIRLTRNPFPDDKHPSETALDQTNFDQSLFDAILDNANLGVEETSEELYGLMRRWDVVSAKSVRRVHL